MVLYCYKRGLPSAARNYVTISLWNSPVQIDLRTQQALGWVEPPTIKIFIHKPTPRSNFCLLAPAQFSKHTPPFGRVDPGAQGQGEPPANKILLYKPTLGVPPGLTFMVAPWLGAEPGWNEEPTPNFGVMGCVGLAAGHRTYIHTHTHTLSSLYRR